MQQRSERTLLPNLFRVFLLMLQMLRVQVSGKRFA